MPASYLNFTPGGLSLTFNLYDNSLTGTNIITVNAVYVEPLLGGSFFDPVDMTGDPIFNIQRQNEELENQIFEITVPTLSYAEGNYNFNLTVTASLSGIQKIIPVFLSVINDNSEPTPEKEYNLKYLLEHSDIEGNQTRCEIYQLGYIGESIDINGTITHNYQEKTDLHEPIVASNIKLDLEANGDLTLNDLYSEEERAFKVILKRNDEVIFIGFIKPDGIFEDYVYDRWVLSIDAYDGLSTLKNLTFVNDNGIIFSGRFSGLNIFKNCLHRTGLDLPININCNIYYDTFSGFSILQETYFNTDRYYSGSDPMDCESVMKSLLQVFNATIIQMNGEWWIYRAIDLKSETYFARYVDGVYDKNIMLQPIVEIGSHIEGSEIFHCNSNQKKSIGASVQAYRITYEFGAVNSIFQNGELRLTGGGLDMDGWTINNFDGNVNRISGNNGILENGLTSKVYTGNSDPTMLILNQSIDINEGAIINLVIEFANEGVNSVGLRFAIGIGGQYYNLEDQQWQNTGVINFVANYLFEGFYPSGDKICRGRGNATFELNQLRAPISGTLDLVIYRDRHNVGAGDFKIYRVNLTPSSTGNVQGREYTGRRTTMTSTVTKSNITVYNGDSVSDLFVGTIYKSDADSPTETWYREGRTESKELLEINAEDNLRLSPRPMLIFEGDIYGYIPYLSLVSINNITGLLQPIKYSFQTDTCVLQLSSKEFSNEYLEDFSVEIKDNYGNETQVTIV